MRETLTPLQAVAAATEPVETPAVMMAKAALEDMTPAQQLALAKQIVVNCGDRHCAFSMLRLSNLARDTANDLRRMSLTGGHQ